MEFKKVAILGAGAVGSYVLWGLSEKEGIDLCVIGNGLRREKIEKEGIIINDVKYIPKVCTAEEARGVDLLVVCLKYTALRGALEDIRTIVDDHTVIMSLMNGVDSEEIIAEVVNEEQILYSYMVISSERIGNSIKFDPDKTVGMIFGEKDDEKSSDRVEAMAALFDGTGLHYKCSEDILTEMWGKYLRNIGNNLIQAIVGCGLGGYDDSEHMAFLKGKLEEEVIAVAKAKGITLMKPAATLTVSHMIRPAARFSTLQDLDAKRHTEIDMFSGSVVRMGKELGIETPYSEYTYHIIKALEEKNDGKLDY